VARQRKDLPSESPQEMAEVMLGVRGVHLIGLEDGLKVVRVVIETLAEEARCPQCGREGELYDRPVRELEDAPAFGRPLIFEWHTRRWQCPNQTNLSEHTPADLLRVQRSLNGRPRETLGLMMPRETLAELIALTA
jgi:hypothetical protein